MIYSFSVKNFLSIRDMQTVSFATTSDKTDRDLLAVEVKPNVFINKLGIFYGANAAGKSNMLFAIDTLFDLMTIPMRDKSQTITAYTPFALNDGEPIYFGIVFYKEGIRYDYEVAYCKTHIISERLDYYPARGKAMFYTRRFTDADTQPDIEFGGTLRLFARSKQAIRENTLNNHTVLSTIAKISLKEDAADFVKLYSWLSTRTHKIGGDNQGNSMAREIKSVCDDPAKKQFYLDMLKKADFNITDIAVVEDFKGMSAQLIEQIQSSMLPESTKFGMLNDVVFRNHSDEGDFDIKSAMQSDGTRRFTELLDYLYTMVRANHIYLFDELGNRMHYDLVVYYILLFLRNSDQSQLLFSTHSIMLLDEDFIRRDMIYLADKDKSTASSAYTRVSDMGLHKNLSIFKAYKIGRLGGTPDVGSTYMDIRKSEER